jgi:uncharacterized protein YggU (UPF0235/DUF167 family)
MAQCLRISRSQVHVESGGRANQKNFFLASPEVSAKV